MFRDRYDAAIQLVGKLKQYKNKNGIVLAVPRGGVPIGCLIAKELGLPIEVVLSKKIGHPFNREFAIGSVSLHGVIINPGIGHVKKSYIEKESEKILKDLQDKFVLFMGGKKPTDLKNKIVIIVDDGVATGSTIKATVHSVRKSNPKEVVVAVPVAPPDTARHLKEIADTFICLHTPQDFFGVGQFYNDFSEVSDEEVVELLRDTNAKAKAA
jgi:putative phosphoribosyl transferase